MDTGNTGGNFGCDGHLLLKVLIIIQYFSGNGSGMESKSADFCRSEAVGAREVILAMCVPYVNAHGYFYFMFFYNTVFHFHSVYVSVFSKVHNDVILLPQTVIYAYMITNTKSMLHQWPVGDYIWTFH